MIAIKYQWSPIAYNIRKSLNLEGENDLNWFVFRFYYKAIKGEIKKAFANRQNDFIDFACCPKAVLKRFISLSSREMLFSPINDWSHHKLRFFQTLLSDCFSTKNKICSDRSSGTRRAADGNIINRNTIN